jgi:hypothetical protein
MSNLATIFFLCLVALASSGKAEEPDSRTIMDRGQCPPYYDPDSGFWGYDCQYSPDPGSESTSQHIKVSPQFSWASPFINGRARVLLGCRLASCRHEPKGRTYHERLYVFIDRNYDFEPRDPYDPEIWNPKHYAIYNEGFVHVGSFNQDYLGLACVAYRGSVAYINRDGNIVFAEGLDGRISVPLTPELREFLDTNRVGYSTEEASLVFDPSPEVMDYLLESFQPPVTPVTAHLYGAR